MSLGEATSLSVGHPDRLRGGSGRPRSSDILFPQHDRVVQRGSSFPSDRGPVAQRLTPGWMFRFPADYTPLEFAMAMTLLLYLIP